MACGCGRGRSNLRSVRNNTVVRPTESAVRVTSQQRQVQIQQNKRQEMIQKINENSGGMGKQQRDIERKKRTQIALRRKYKPQ